MATKTKLTAADEKFLATLTIGTEKGTRQNPFSGATFELDPTCLACYDYVMANYNNGAPLCGIQKFDRAKYIVLKLNPEAYFGLID